MLKRLGQLIIVVLVALGGYYLYTSVFAGTFTSNNLNDGLVGYWSFEEGSGLQAGDMSGNGNDGVLINMEDADWELAKHGYGLHFDGADEFVRNTTTFIPDDNTDDYSLSVWFNADDVTGSQNVSSWTSLDDSSEPYSMLHFRNDSMLRFWVRDNQGDTVADISTGVLSNDTWYHAVGVKEGTQYTLYMDGAEATTSVGVISGSFTDRDRFLIGTVNEGTNEDAYSFDGVIDEVRTYNRALSHEEVRSLYNLSANKFQATQEAQLADGLVGYWSFDGPDMDLGSSTSEVKDSSGNGNHGNWVNHATTTVVGKMGQAIDFDGVDDEIIIAQGAALKPTTSITVSAWVKPTSYQADNKKPVSWDGGSGNAYHITVYPRVSSSDIRFICGIRVDGQKATSAASVPFGGWHHVACTYDGATLTMYVNGGAKKTLSLSGPIEYPVFGQEALVFGKDDGYFEGVIDEVRVYDRALSDTEVEQLYQMGLGVKINTTQETKQTGGLVGHWSFDGPYMDWASTMAEVLDSSGNDYYGNATTSMSSRGNTAIGIVGQAIKLDGTNDDIRATTSYNGYTLPMTVSAWVYPDTSGTDDGILALDDPVGGGYYGIGLAVASNGTITLEYGNGTSQTSTGRRTKTSTTAVATNQWQHIVGVVRGATDMDIYINGVNAGGTYSGTGGAIAWTGAQTITAIGDVWGSWPSSLFGGLIDEVRVYDVALTESEILDMYTRESGKNRLDVGLVGYWPFRAGTSTEARDHSEFGNHGTLTNMTDADWVTGKIGYGLDFDGSNDYVSISDSASLDLGSGDFTYSAWVKISSAYDCGAQGVGHVIMSQRDPNDPYAFLACDNTNQRIWFGVEDSAGTAVTATGTTVALNDDTWHHVVGVKSGHANTEISVYVDGVLDGVNTGTYTGNFNYSAAAPTNIGRFNVSPYYELQANIDEVRIYERALSPAEVTALYNLDK